MEDVKEYPGKSVTRNKVVSEDYSASIVHFSTHGFFMVPSDKSYLVLSDSKLTVQDIWGLPLDRSVMVTLSACETGKGLVLNGDEVISLENAFIYAGAPSVLATLWQVEAESAAILTGSFYKYLMSGKNKAVSLKLAQDDVRHNQKHDYSSPYYWAGYTLRGAWHEINPNNSK
jgi:CHAT domain-containing protein